MQQQSESLAVGANAVEAWYLLQELMYVNPVPEAIKAVLEMHIPDMLSQSGPLTSAQIADHLPHRSPDAAQKLERILRLLVHKRFFAICESESGEVRYGLTDVSKYFITGSEFDMSTYAVLLQRPELPDSLKYLRETVEEGANGFELANETSLWSYTNANPGFSDVFNAAMRSGSKLQCAVLARCYEGFRDVKCLVDVGGGVGGAVGEIVRLNPHIVGKNFDLPHVIAAAPQIRGVEHISGNFLESVPSGDAILLQRCLHNWVDEDCVTILKNCLKALPDNGKVIIRELVIDSPKSSAAKTNAALHSDLLMLGLFNGRGRERTTKDWEYILKEAGFPQASFLSLQGFDVIESVKTDATPGLRKC